MNLQDKVNKMLADVRSGKAQRAEQKRKKLVKKKEKEEGIIFEKVLNPYKNEAIVLLTNITTCSCGEVHSSPNEFLLLEKTRIRFNRPETTLEKIELNNVLHVFAHLPTRTLERYYKTEACSVCFTATTNPYHSAQLSFQFTQPENLH